MNWRECVQMHESWGTLSRFDWPLGTGRLGFDCDPSAFTISDVLGGLNWIWTWPGDAFLGWQPVRTFFELGSAPVVGNGWSYVFPFLAYFAFLVAVYVFFAVLFALLGGVKTASHALLRMPRAIWLDLRVIVRMVLRALHLMPPRSPQ